MERKFSNEQLAAASTMLCEATINRLAPPGEASGDVVTALTAASERIGRAFELVCELETRLNLVLAPPLGQAGVAKELRKAYSVLLANSIDIEVDRIEDLNQRIANILERLSI